ncbi:unnamed protein product [Clavelina lepadiformis]|uniref:Ribosome biogenesis protein SLX9 n=1 Tax=Clavelina lepadiformis TaxID=159417 RepID=A0ABP0F4V4_CLALP
MGKIRVKKARVHLKASSVPPLDDQLMKTGNNDNYNTMSTNDSKPQVQPVSIEQNPFSGLKIDFSLLKDQQLEIPDEQTVKKEKPDTSQTLSLKKKDRQKQKRINFVQKLEASRMLKREKQKAEKRAKTAVVGDLNFLKLALPEFTNNNDNNTDSVNLPKDTSKPNLKNLMSLEPSNKKNPTSLKKPTSSKMKSKQRQKQAISEIANFQNLLKNKAFQKDKKSFIEQNLKRNLL